MSIPIYESTFTPYKEEEGEKECPKCKKVLHAKKFKPSHVTRNSVKGIARNMKCRKCEEHLSKSKKEEKTTKTDLILHEHSRKIEKIETDFKSVIKNMKDEIRLLNLEIQTLRSQRVSGEDICNIFD